jgi:hypothetical protein
MRSFDPKNKTALEQQLMYQGVGNPPGSHPALAVGNFFPGLEFNFLNVWKRIFVGIELLESSGQVIEFVPDDVREPAAKRVLQKLKRLLENDDKTDTVYLIKVEYSTSQGDHTTRLLRYGKGPAFKAAPPEDKENPYLSYSYFSEWGNALAHMHFWLGGKGKATCHFLAGAVNEKDEWVTSQRLTAQLNVRRLIEKDDAGDTALISQTASLAGEITESLCSPWQTDYIGCACFYWASNRPDFVNVEKVTVRATDLKNKRVQGSDVHLRGQHWLDVPLDDQGMVTRPRGQKIPRSMKSVTLPGGRDEPKPFYTLQRKENKKGKLLKHEDVLHEWESKFEFIIGGHDAPDGLATGPHGAQYKLHEENIGPGLHGTVRVQGEGSIGGSPDHRRGRAKQ